MYDNFAELEKECNKCSKCALCKTRHNVVFGVGNTNADVMFIGEGPGENEDLQGEPFVGKAGQLLDKYLKVIDLDRSRNIYIFQMANLVYFYIFYENLVHMLSSIVIQPGFC